MEQNNAQQSIDKLRCAYCKTSFTPKWWNHIYCTPVCQKAIVSMAQQASKKKLKELKGQSNRLRTGTLKNSHRLQVMLEALIDCQPHTTKELMLETGSVSISSDIYDLKKNGKRIKTECEGKNENGRMIYTYQLMVF